MTLGIIGAKGAGKSLLMTAFVAWLDNILEHKLPIHCSYPLFLPNAQRFTRFSEISRKSDCIIAWDEIHMSMDSRGSKYISLSKDYSDWISIIRHFRTTLVYTTISMDRVDLRLRNETDYLWQVKDIGDGRLKIQTIDWQSWQLGRIFLLENKTAFYELYDSYAIIEPIIMPQNKYSKLKN